MKGRKGVRKKGKDKGREREGGIRLPRVSWIMIPGLPNKRLIMRVRMLPQLIKFFPCKHEDLSLILRTLMKKPGMVACPYNPSAGERKLTGHPA